MTVHLLAEVLPRWCEVEDQMEILSYALKEAVVEFVSFRRVLTKDGALIL